jgi:hypothetical protein
MASFSGGVVASGGGGGVTGATEVFSFGTDSTNIVVATFDQAAVSETAPESPAEGEFWFDSANADLFIYYNNAWVGLT